MPKLSIYVPDELWGKACQVDPLANPSQLVQRGLGSMLQGRTEEATGSPIPVGAEERLATLRTHFAQQARTEYQAGYSGALDVADQIPWYVLEDLANAKFDVRRWIEKWRRSAVGLAHRHSPPAWLYAVAKTLGDLADPIGIDEISFTPTRACIRGFSDALRLVWETVDLETLGLATPPKAEGTAGTGDDA